MKKIIISISAIFVLILGFYGAVFFIDYQKAYKNFLENIKIIPDSQNTNALNLHKFPLPYLYISSIKEDNKLELLNIKVNFSFLSLVTLNPAISNIEVENAKIHLDHSDFNLASHDKLITDLIAQKGININVTIKNLALLDSRGNIILAVKDFTFTEGANKLTTSSHNRTFTGIIDDIGSLTGSFAQNKDGTVFKIDILNPNYHFILSENYNNTGLINGVGECHIKNLASFMNNILPEIAFLFQSLNNNQTIGIKFDLMPNEQMLLFKNFNITSDAIHGGGAINISRDNITASTVKLQFSTIDLLSLFTSNNTTPSNLEDFYGITPRFEFINDNISLEILVDQVKIANNEELQTLKFKGQYVVKKFTIDNLSCDISSGGNFKMFGDVTGNPIRNIFNGKIYLTHKDINSLLRILGYDNIITKQVTPINLESDLKFTLIDLYLQNLLLQTDNTKIVGGVTSKFIGSTPRISATLNFSAMDLSNINYPVISPVLEFIKNLSMNMKDKNYFNKFIPLRKIPYFGNFDLTFNNVIFANNKLDKVNLLASVVPSQLNIDHLYINMGPEYLSTSWQLDTSGVKPSLYVKIHEGLASTKSLTPKALLNFQQTLLGDYDLEKVNFKLDCDSMQLQQNGLELKNTRFSLENNDNLLKISNFTADILSGNLQLEGSILLSPFTWNFVYALNSIDIVKFLSLMPRGLFGNSSGGASINGMFTTHGDSMEELLYNFYTKSTLLLKDIIINNCSITDLIANILKPGYDLQQFNLDYKNALLTGQMYINSLKSNVEMTNGVINLQDIEAQTVNASISGNAKMNIYDLGLNANSIFSFNYVDPKWQLPFGTKPSTVVNLPIKISGTLLEMQKTMGIHDVIKFLQAKSKSEP